MRVELTGTVIGIYGEHMNPGPGVVLDLPDDFAARHIELGNAIPATDDGQGDAEAAPKRGPGRPPRAK